MGLFDKKYCDVCGNKIGLLGNRKLEDGNLCKECAGKLSPWFSDRRNSTVEEIKQQLAYREENRKAVADFHTTRTLGRYCKVILDEDHNKFMVTSARNLEEANPDVLEYAQVTGCELDVNETRTEEKREVKNADGRTEKVSYNPPRYSFSYNFYMIIHVNHPYFDEIRFLLNSSSVEIEPYNNVQGRSMQTMHTPRSAQPGFGGFMNSVNQIVSPTALSQEERMANAEYNEYYTMAQEIKEALTNIRTQVREEVAAASAPQEVMTCPHCHATTKVGAAGICEYCGGSLRQ